MLRLVKTLIGGMVALSLVFTASSVFAKEEKEADANIDFTVKQVSVGVGLGWGSGTLKYKGEEYPIKARGFKIGTIGISSSDMTGNVYHLNKVEDIEGSYTTVGVGAAMVGGASSIRTKNDKGVVMEVWGKEKGLELTIGGSGVTIDLVGAGEDYSSAEDDLKAHD
jgi:hypothetical protein